MLHVRDEQICSSTFMMHKGFKEITHNPILCIYLCLDGTARDSDCWLQNDSIQNVIRAVTDIHFCGDMWPGIAAQYDH